MYWSDCFSFLRYWPICVLHFSPTDDAINFEINFSFLILPDQKSQDKKLDVSRTKRAFKVK